MLRDGRAVGDRLLKDYDEVKGYADAARWIYSQATKPDNSQSDCLLTIQEIRHIYRLAVKPVWKVEQPPEAFDAESPGSWRQHDIQPLTRGMTPPDHTQVQSHITNWADVVRRIPLDVQKWVEAYLANRHEAKGRGASVSRA